MNDQQPGLTTQQAQDKLKQFGPNEIHKEKKISWIKLILDQFKSPLIYILFFAGLVTFILGETTDSIVIFLAVLVNGSLGFFQEFKAEKALNALKNKVTPHALVIRDGQKKEIEATELVPGDVVIIKSGQSIPADGEVIEQKDLQVNEAFLTGESRPVKKDEQDQVFLGSNIVSGTGKFKVTETGPETKMGQLAENLEGTVSEQTPLKRQVEQLAKTLTILFGLICVVVFLEGLWRGRELTEMLKLSVSLAVAAVPEGIAISVTMVLALGMERISKQNGLVRKLLAAEALGAVDMICLDKTGTLTEGQMRVVETELENEKMAVYTAVCANSEVNAVDIALKNWGKENSSLSRTECEPDQHKMYPFQSKRKFSAAWTKKDSQDKFYVYGAPELMMKWANLTKTEEQKWQQRLELGAEKGYRAIGLAYLPVKKEPEKKWNNLAKGVDDGIDLIWLGLIFMADPLRGEVKQSLQTAQKAGIEMKVITGDYFHTAVAVMNRLALASGDELEKGKAMSGEALAEIPVEALKDRVKNIKLFYRTEPEQKIKIVKALQANGRTVAMMGDGVNDSLALKKADLGIVVGEATDVAKETADMVLLDSKFSTIVAAIEEGRVIFNNIKKVIVFLLTSSFSEAVLLSISLLLNLPLPITALQILWVNLIEDSLPSLALAFEKDNRDKLLNQQPRKKDSPILDKEMKTIIFIVGLVTDLLLFVLFYLLLHQGYPLPVIQTMIFAGLALDSLLFVFSTKSLSQNIWEIKAFNNWYLNIGVLIGIALLFLAIYFPPLNSIFATQPLNFGQVLIIAGLSLLNVFGIELVKLKFKN
jgi:Ca2+-transporting ATPase